MTTMTETAKPATAADLAKIPSLRELERRHIMHVLSVCGGNKTRAARVLEIDPKTLWNKLKGYEAAAASAQHGGASAR